MTSAPVSQRAAEIVDNWLHNARVWPGSPARDELVAAIDRALSDRVIGLPSREKVARVIAGVMLTEMFMDPDERCRVANIAADAILRLFSVGGEG